MTYENKPYDNKPSDAYPTAPPPSYNATYDESAYLERIHFDTLTTAGPTVYVLQSGGIFFLNPRKPENEGGMGISSQGFESADVRRVFIRKVLGLLL